MGEHLSAQFLGMKVNLDTLIMMWFTMALLIIVSFIATRKLSLVPNRIQMIFEGIIGYFSDIVSGNMGEKEGRKHLPLLLTLFMFILSANLVGQLPLRLIHLPHGELASPNNDINMTAAMAILLMPVHVLGKITGRPLASSTGN